MKYTIFFAALLFVLPMGVLMASYSRRIREIVFGLLLFGTAFTDWFDINFVDRWWYAGSTRGIEVSFVDFLALVLLFSTLLTMRREGARLFWPASLGLMLIFFGYGCFSVMTSDPKLFGLFELTKLVRGFVVFLTVAWYVRTKRDAYVLMFALGAVLIYEGGLSIWQRYIESIYRVRGTFPHENILGDYCILVAPVLLSCALFPLRPVTRIFFAAAWTSAAVAVILTIARMPAAVFVAASAGVAVTGLGFRLDPQRLAIALGLCILASALFYRGADRLLARQEAADQASVDSSGDELRSRHYAMGFEMAKHHPFGVGLNNWGWYTNEYAQRLGFWSGLPYASTSDPGEGNAGQAHTLYGLTLGELGWPGLAIFSALVARWLCLSGSLLFARPIDLWSRLGVGCFFGFLAEFVANGTEITFRNQQVLIIFNVLLGFVVAVRRARIMDTIRGRP
ncbi:MAG: O-antigen ligase family protein [Candidatus Hydrogenedentales bacterium]|jgi:hypothetical protein